MDVISKKKRSETMRAIKSKNTKLEKEFKKVLKSAGYRFKSNVANLTGKPDIFFPKQKLVIFLDSCFWHGCKQHCRFPSSNRIYWKNKIARNKGRDSKVTQQYRGDDWRVLRIWEHQLRKNPNIYLKKIDELYTRSESNL